MYLLKKPLPPAYIMVLKEVKRALRRDDHRHRHRHPRAHRGICQSRLQGGSRPPSSWGC